MVSSADLFPGGSALAAEPATAGSYGTAPSGYRLPDSAYVGEVRLTVSDLDRSVEYYTSVLGLLAVNRGDGAVALHARGEFRCLAVLEQIEGRPEATPRAHLGLYHFAILLPNRSSLGQFVRHLGELGVRAGAGDHLVSEAFYLTDPDGHGIEVYADRPRESWMREGRELVMATDPVDIEGLLAASEGERWNGMPQGTRMGHVHLHVGGIEKGAEFYSSTLGLDVMVSRYPGALFLAAGGYHHHVGLNTWAGPAAVAVGPNQPRLSEWTLVVPSASDADAVAQSLRSRSADFVRNDDGSVLAHDPWGTVVRIRAEHPR